MAYSSAQRLPIQATAQVQLSRTKRDHSAESATNQFHRIDYCGFDLAQQSTASHDQLHSRDLQSEVASAGRSIPVAAVDVAMLDVLVAGLAALRAANSGA